MPRSTEPYDLLRPRLERFTRMLQGVEKGDVRALHRTRVASRRLREVLPVLQLDPEVAHKLSRRLRKITARLGTVREFDVLLGVIDELRETGRRYPNNALARVAANIGEDRSHARERLLAKVPIDELRRVAAKLDKMARAVEKDEAPRRSGTARRSWRWALDARVARRASTLAAAMSDAGAVYLAERLHAVRISVKKLRYALELATEAAQVKSSPDVRQLRRVQDVLGRLHDLQVLIDRARDVQASLTPPDITAWRELDGLVVALEEDCRRLHGRYMHDAAALMALCSRLSGNLESKSQKVKLRRM
ncbi:MAG TPA: CHAD domain-containing protein [Vicinamibacterales bacterium]